VDPAQTTSLVGNNPTNRISYSTFLGNTGFFSSNVGESLAYSRSETYVINPTGVTVFQKFGSEAALSVSVNSIRETGYKLVEWLISLESLNSSSSFKRQVNEGSRITKDSKFNQNRNKGGKRKRGPNRSKGQNNDELN